MEVQVSEMPKARFAHARGDAYKWLYRLTLDGEYPTS